MTKIFNMQPSINRYEHLTMPRISPAIRFSSNSGVYTYYNKKAYQHFTELFREKKQILAIPQLLKKYFPEGCTIYDYACSDGSEPYSIAITLKENGIDSKKYPLIARDISPTILKIARSGYINFEPCELDLISRYFTGSNPSKYFTKMEEITDENVMKYYNLNEEDLKYIGYRLSNYDSSERHYRLYRVADSLKSLIKFEHGDLSKDKFFRHKNDYYRKKPCLILFNNQLYHLNENDQCQMLENIFKHSNPGTIFWDESIFLDNSMEPDTAEIAKEVGFKRLTEDKNNPFCKALIRP